MMKQIEGTTATQLTKENTGTTHLHPQVDEWWAWSRTGFARSPVSYWIVVALIAIIAVGEQVLLYSLGGSTVSQLTGQNIARLLSIPAVFLYCLTALPTLNSVTVKQLNKLRRVVLISDDAYHEHVRRIICIPYWTELSLLAGSVLFVVLLFGVLNLPIPTTALSTRLPADPVATVIILTTFSVLGWLFLLLIYTSIKLGRGLNLLAQEPIAINVFDPFDRLPFGRLSLMHSLTLVGLILVLILPLGRPTEPLEFFVVGLLSFGSLCALVLPLRGVRRQVERAKDDVLEKLEGEFYDVQQALMTRDELDNETLNNLEQRAKMLYELQDAICRSPTWPFRNASSTIRAALAATSPIIYFLFTELLRSILLPLLNR